MIIYIVILPIIWKIGLEEEQGKHREMWRFNLNLEGDAVLLKLYHGGSYT